MADTRQLQLILSLKDNASSKLSALRGTLKENEAAIRNVGRTATVAFAAVSGAIGLSVKAAAEAEGTWNKFNTVFGDGADEMRAFVSDIRKEMPTATDQIARMGADLQDLLVPMGIARDEAMGMTQGFLDLANKVAAFNDVDPTQVLEAMKSGLAGSSEPLRRFSISVLETDIEMQAMKDGLLEAGQTLKDLDPVTRRQVRAQALLNKAVADSGDAINGFEENNDSLIRRMQNLKANFREVSISLGNIFIPIVDNAVKKLLPLVEKFKEWADNNPELVKTITLLVLGFTGLVVVLSAVALAMAVFNLQAILVGGGIVLLAAIIIGLVIAFKFVKDKLKKFKDFMVTKWEEIKSNISSKVNKIKEKLKEFWDTFGTAITVIAGFITGLYIPKLIAMATQTAITAGKMVAQWVVMAAKALWSATVQAVQAIPMIIAGLIKLGIRMMITSGIMIAQFIAMTFRALIWAGSMALAWIIAFGPIAIIIGLIIALGIIIFKNWDLIVQKTTELWKKVTEKWGQLVKFLKEKAEDLKNKLIEAWDAVAGAFKRTKDWIVENVFDPIWGWIQKLIDGINTVKDGIKSIGGKVVEGAKAVGGKVKEGAQAVGGFFKKITPFANGGIVTKPTMGLVGEAGPEAIVPLSKAGGLGNNNIVITGNTFMSDDEAAEKIGDMIIGKLKLSQNIN